MKASTGVRTHNWFCTAGTGGLMTFCKAQYRRSESRNSRSGGGAAIPNSAPRTTATAKWQAFIWISLLGAVHTEGNCVLGTMICLGEAGCKRLTIPKTLIHRGLHPYG